MSRLEFPKIEAAHEEACSDVPWDATAEVRRDLDQIFAAPQPTTGRVRVAFVERESAGRGVFSRLTVRDAALAAAAAVLGGVAGASLAPHPIPALKTPTVTAGEARGVRAEPTAATAPVFAYSALSAPPSPSQPVAPPPPQGRPAAELRGSQTAGERLSPATMARRATAAPLRGVQPTPPAEEAREARAPSCADMPTLADERICDSARLAEAQEDLGAAYNAALAAAERPRALLREQADWLDARDVAARRSDRALERLYRRRTEELWRRADEGRLGDEDASSWRDGR